MMSQQRENRPSKRKGLGWWLHWTAPAGAMNYEAVLSRKNREWLRRAGLTSFVAPFVFIAPLLLLQQANVDPITMGGIVLLMIIACIALVFNRFGHQTIAALLLILSMDIVIEGSLLTASGGLSTGWLLTFDLFVIPLIASGVLLSRQYVWIFMVLHITCILGDFYLLPHAHDLQVLIQVWHGPGIAFARPLIIQIGAALLSFIEVRSTDQAIARADQAEELGKLREQVAQEKRALELGVQEIVKTLTNAANGHYATSSLLPQDNVLWRISSTLNTLFHRLQNARKQELTVHQTEQDAGRIVESIRAAKRGQYPGWPHPSGGILDPLIRELREAGTPSSSNQQSSPNTPQQPFPSSQYSFPPSSSQYTFPPSSSSNKEKPGSRTQHGFSSWIPENNTQIPEDK